MEELSTLVAEASTQYVGRWNRLISTTNWEKGRIICEWRQAMKEAGAPAGSCTDEVWSREVGNVSPQHVGRLRRTCERFGAVYDQYPGLYWSHFQAAIEWPDAEMYLEGAVQSGWSVAQMCDQRWEALGVAADARPSEADVMAGDLDEDANAAAPGTISDSLAEVHGAEDVFDADADADARGREPAESREAADSLADAAAAEPLRPFASLPPLPPDVKEAFELFKLAILNHKVSGWREMARNDLLAVLDSLKQLALAPAE